MPGFAFIIVLLAAIVVVSARAQFWHHVWWTLSLGLEAAAIGGLGWFNKSMR